jgi:5'-deoxynucleotidase
MLPIFDLCNSMASITRWSHATCLRSESVLEHTGFVAVYSYQLALKHGVSIGDCLEKAIVHDMEEVITGDIPTPTKYASDAMRESIATLETSAALAISKEVFSDQMFHAWSNSKSLGRIEGQIVYLADLAAVVYKILAEEQLGNRTFEEYRIGIAARLYIARDCVGDILNEDVDDLLRILGEMK